jgi:hypothetical protein
MSRASWIAVRTGSASGIRTTLVLSPRMAALSERELDTVQNSLIPPDGKSHQSPGIAGLCAESRMVDLGPFGCTMV